MQVTFYHFSKRENSTKRPDSGTDYDCILKSPSSIISPVITLQIGLVSDPSYFNYCYIPDFDRYYWVQEWSWSRACWTAALKCDPLATWRWNIGSTSLYVLRSSATYDGDIIDSLYPTKSNPTMVTTTGPYPWNYIPSQAGTPLGYQLGTFILEIAGAGISKLIAMSYAQLQTLTETLSTGYVTEDNDFSATDASFALQAAMIDPFQYIKSCRFYPFPFAEMGGAVTGLTIGGVTFPDIGYKLAPGGYPVADVLFRIPMHPSSASRGKYVNASCTDHRLFYPPFGMISLNPDMAYNYTYVICKGEVDFMSGYGRALIGYSSDASTLEYMESVVSAKVGMDIQLSQIYTDLYEGLNVTTDSAASLIGSAFRMDIGGMISNTVSGITSQNRAMRPRLDTIGDSSGGFTSLSGIPTLYSEFLIPVDDDNDHYGRPLCKVRTPASLGGYMLIQDGDVPIPGTAEEAREIRQYLEGGFYYE